MGNRASSCSSSQDWCASKEGESEKQIVVQARHKIQRRFETPTGEECSSSSTAQTAADTDEETHPVDGAGNPLSVSSSYERGGPSLTALNTFDNLTTVHLEIHQQLEMQESLIRSLLKDNTSVGGLDTVGSQRSSVQFSAHSLASVQQQSRSLTPLLG